jgi:hypothetical protein
MADSIEKMRAVNGKTIYRTKDHWAVLLGPAFLVLLGILSFEARGSQAIVLIILGAVWGIFSYISLQRSEFILTKDRLMIRVGFPVMRSYDIPLKDILFFDSYQPSLGSMLNFGKIILVDSGKRKRYFRMVARPMDFVQKVQAQINAVKHPEKPAKA